MSNVSEIVEKFNKKVKDNLGKLIWWEIISSVSKFLSLVVLIIGIVSAVCAYKSAEIDNSVFYSTTANNLTLAGSLISAICMMIDWYASSKKAKIEQANIIETVLMELKKNK